MAPRLRSSWSHATPSSRSFCTKQKCCVCCRAAVRLSQKLHSLSHNAARPHVACGTSFAQESMCRICPNDPPKLRHRRDQRAACSRRAVGPMPRLDRCLALCRNGAPRPQPGGPLHLLPPQIHPQNGPHDRRPGGAGSHAPQRRRVPGGLPRAEPMHLRARVCS